MGGSCAPIVPPVQAMSREKVSRVEGLLEAVILPSGLISNVVVSGVLPEGIRADIEAWLTQALTTAPCRFPPMQTELRIEIPFLVKLD